MSRLSTRLDRIEKATTTEVSDESNEMLVSLLARRDALFWPWRNINFNRGAIAELQRDYLAGRRGIAVKADGKEDWKAAHYTRNELIRRGLVTPQRSSGQVTTLFLTESGEAAARVMVGLPSVQVAMLVLLVQAVGFDFGRHWVSESSLFQQRLVGNPADWQHLEEWMLPLLTCGAVVANNDVPGRVYYAIENLDLLPLRAKQEIVEGNVPDLQVAAPTTELHSRYIKDFDAERATLERKERSDEILIPVSASLDPWQPEPEHTEATVDNGK